MGWDSVSKPQKEDFLFWEKTTYTILLCVFFIISSFFSKTRSGDGSPVQLMQILKRMEFSGIQLEEKRQLILRVETAAKSEV